MTPRLCVWRARGGRAGRACGRCLRGMTGHRAVPHVRSPGVYQVRHHRALAARGGGAWGGGGGGAWGVVCCLVLQAPAGRPWEPDAEPAGGVFSLDTPPPGH